MHAALAGFPHRIQTHPRGVEVMRLRTDTVPIERGTAPVDPGTVRSR